MLEKSQIYTKTGDKGTTSLYGGMRVPKTDTRIVVVGELDELNASLGVATATPGAWNIEHGTQELRETLFQIQNLLFNIGAEVADVEKRTSIQKVVEKHTRDLEQLIDHFDSRLPELETFILPGGSPAGSELHRARAVCRRAERAVVHLAAESDLNPEIERFLNRLGDFLFVFARYLNHINNAPETTWKK